MGRVYRAYDRLLDMEVAVKLLNHEFSRDQEAINQLKEETRISLQLLHRHIVRFYNLEKRQNQFLIIMEYVPGVSLHKYMAQMPQGLVPLDLVLQIVGVMADALGYAHRKGVLHKDITPSNVLISEDGVLKLIDFGIADLMNRQRVIPDYVIGTPVYMSPEQLRGDELDARRTLFTWCMTHQMMSGRCKTPGSHSGDAPFMPHPPLVGFRRVGARFWSGRWPSRRPGVVQRCVISTSISARHAARITAPRSRRPEGGRTSRMGKGGQPPRRGGAVAVGSGQ